MNEKYLQEGIVEKFEETNYTFGLSENCGRAYILLAHCTHEGSFTLLSPECMSIGELDEQIDRMKRELDRTGEHAHKDLAKSKATGRWLPTASRGVGSNRQLSAITTRAIFSGVASQICCASVVSAFKRQITGLPLTLP